MRARLIIGRVHPTEYYVISPDYPGFLTSGDSFIHAVRMGCDLADLYKEGNVGGGRQFTIPDLVRYGCRRFWHKTITPRSYLPHKTNNGHWRELPSWWPLGSQKEYKELIKHG